MKYIKSYKLFESKSYKVGDVVKIRYWATQDVALAKITDWLPKKKYCQVTLCDKDGVNIEGSNKFQIKKSDIISSYKLTNDPVTFRNPANIPADFIRKDAIRMSNDIAHHGIF
jgi:hypothetical protein